MKTRIEDQKWGSTNQVFETLNVNLILKTADSFQYWQLYPFCLEGLSTQNIKHTHTP